MDTKNRSNTEQKTMNKETFYFSHDYNARSDWKLIKVAMKHGMEWIWTYWSIVEMLYEEWWYLNIEEYERITFELRVSYELVNSLINNFWLFEKDDTKFWSNSVIDRLKQRMDKSEKARESINKRWDKKKKENTNVLPTNYECNTIKERKGKEIKEKKNNISKDIWEQALVVTNEIIKEEHGDPEINNILETIKEQVEFLWFIYKKWSHERERAQNILTGKEFWDICEKSNLSRVEFCKSIIFISSKLDFWNGKIYNAETLYKNYAMVYNTAMSKKYWPKSESALDIVL